MSSARTVFPRQRERELLHVGQNSRGVRVDLRLFWLFERAGLPCSLLQAEFIQECQSGWCPGGQTRILILFFGVRWQCTQGMSISELGDISHSPPCRAGGRNDTRCSGFQHVRLAPGHSTPSTWHNMMRRKSSRTRHRQQEFVFQIAVYIYLIIIIIIIYHGICLLLCFSDCNSLKAYHIWDLLAYNVCSWQAYLIVAYCPNASLGRLSIKWTTGLSSTTIAHRSNKCFMHDKSADESIDF